MNREQKAAAMQEIAADIKGAEAILAVDYRGISVPQIAELRAGLRDAETSFRVVKNSLTERAADESGAELLKPLLIGPTALVFVRGDVASAAKTIADYGRATQLLPFKGGMMDGDALDVEQIRSLSRLPPRQVLYGQLVGVVASPVSGLVRSLGALLGGLAVALGQVREKMQSGEIPSASPAGAEASPPAEQQAPAKQSASPTGEQAPQPAAEAATQAATPAESEEAQAAEAATDEAAPAEGEQARAQQDGKQADGPAEAQSADDTSTKED